MHFVRTFLLGRFPTNFITNSSVVNFSMVISGSTAITYLMDTHGGNAVHVMALVGFMKCMALYGFNMFANGMVMHKGVRISLLILAGCQAACWLTSIPMYRYGKRIRAFVSYWLYLCLFNSLLKFDYYKISRYPSFVQEQGV